METIRPLKDSVLVKQDDPKEKTEGGIFLIDSNDRKLHDDLGTVLAVGPKVGGVRVGDRVMFSRRPSSHLGDLKEEWKNLLMLREEDCHAILEE